MTQHNAALVEETNASIERTEEQASELDRIVEVFTIINTDAPVRTTSAPKAASQNFSRGIKGLQERVKTAAKSYLSHGNTAVATQDKDWEEF